MFIALDKNGKRVYIDDTSSSEEYFCPCPSCQGKLIVRKGQINVHHFAHRPKTKCADYWHEDMSEWHKYWQSLFPVEMQEIYKEKDDSSHRADVLIEKTKIVLEFQHSSLSSEEFEDRNFFYNSLGYKVIWIFDLTDKYDEGKIKSYRRDLFSWSHPKKTFAFFDPETQKNKVELYFQIRLQASKNEALKELQTLQEGGNSLSSDDLTYIYEHKNDKNELIKVTWLASDGFNRFGTDGYFYSENDIVDRYSKPTDEKSRKYRLGDLFDKLPQLYIGRHTTYYSGCPISSTHICADSNIEIAGSLYDEIMPCIDCEYDMCGVSGPDIPLICKKRFMDTGLSPNEQVEILEKNDNGLITKIGFQKEGTYCELKIPTFSIGKTIFELWKNKYESAVFVNAKTLICVKIAKDPRIQFSRFRNVKGYLSNSHFVFNGDWRDIYGCDKPEWFCIYFKEKNG